MGRVESMENRELVCDFGRLRTSAEEKLQNEEEAFSDLPIEEVRRLVHELRVHQIELEMQNEELRQAQARLEDSRDRLAELYDFAPVGYLTLDGSGKILEANLTAGRMLGVERARLIGSIFGRFVIPDDGDGYYRFLKGLPTTPGPRTCEVRLRGNDGSPRTVRLESAPVDAAGAPSTTRVAMSDLTEQRKAEATLREREDADRRRAEERELRRNEERLRLLSVGNPAYLSEVDHSGIIRYVSRSHPGLRSCPVVGTALTDWFPEDQRPRIREVVGELFRTGQPEMIEYTVSDLGEDRRTYLAHFTPMVREGVIESVTLTSTDITGRRRAEEEVKRERDRAQQYLDIAGVLMVAVDRDQKIVLVNKKACQVLGREEGELLGENWFDLVLPETERDRINAVFTDLMAGLAEPWAVVEYSVITMSGEVRLVAWSNTVVRDGDGRIVGTLSSGTDISDQRKAEAERATLEAQLFHARKMEAIGVLAGGISHDFNNLLTVIQGYLSLIRAKSGAVSEYGQEFEEMDACAKSAADLTRQLLGFAQGGKYEAEGLDLNCVLGESSRMFGRTRKDITLRRDLQQEIWPVEASRSQIEQVLLNLFVNAAHAMPGGGDLGLKTENVVVDSSRAKGLGLKDGKYVRVSVSDTGMGMDPQTLDRVFEPFFTTKQLGRGTGLGLASAYGIIRNHGGAITAESEIGRGTTFIIFLPATATQILPKEEVPVALRMGHGTILVVDDENLIIRLCSRLLPIMGYDVLSASGGKSALEIFRRERGRISLVILDMIMPEMGGGETFDALRALDPSVKILLASGYSLEDRAREIMKKGCNGFIQKPFGIAELSTKLAEILH